MGSTALHWEPGEPILLWNGFLESSSVSAGGRDILVPTSGRTTLKKKPSILKIDNMGQAGGQGGRLLSYVLENTSDFSSRRIVGDSLEAAGWEKG